MTIYISGPITGNPDFREQFEDAAAVIAERGLSYINPAALGEVMPGMTWGDYMAVCWLIIQKADAIVFLPGSNISKGSRLEKSWAKIFGLRIYDLERGEFRECDD